MFRILFGGGTSMSRDKLAALTTLALAIALWAAGQTLAGHGGGGGGGHGGGGHGGYGGGFGGYGGYGGYGRGWGYGGFYGGYGFGYGLGLGFDPGCYYGYPGYGYGYGGDYPGLLVSPVYPVGGVPPVAAASAAPPPQGLAAAPPSPPQGADNRAHIHVVVPTGALVWFEGAVTTQTGAERNFVSPELSSDGICVYEIKARWTQSGQPVERTLEVKVQRNKMSVADFHALPPPREVAASLGK
jgi:uncharacterized protein (TIGR03000 family)